jgi:glycosyltransferase involved in cell wall biosynthesis
MEGTTEMNDVNFKRGSDSSLRVALVHYWYVRRRGGERVLEVLGDMFPHADIFMLVYDEAGLTDSIKAHKVTGSFLQKLPHATRYHRALLPFYPLALEQLRLDEYDLVVSQESGPAKGVITRADTCHICYCHTPMRYLWDMYHEYLSMAPFGFVGKGFYSLACHYVRQWDYATAARVDHFVASSQNGARRIRKYYGRGSDVIYPPVDLDSFSVSDAHDDFYLVVSPLVAYKRVDLAVEACNALGRRLIVIGDGPQKSELLKMAGPTVTFLGFQTDEVVREHYGRCRAFLFPGEEDIGLTPIEAQASGRPVIAYGRGGALETVAGFYPGEDVNPEEATGVFFAEQSADALMEAILGFETVESKFSPTLIRAQAERFDVAHFREQLGNFIAEKVHEFRDFAERRTALTAPELARTASPGLK